jgi:hypothetical protein
MLALEVRPVTDKKKAVSTVKIDKLLLVKLRRIAALSEKKIKIFDYIDNLIRGAIERDYDRASKKFRESSE